MDCGDDKQKVTSVYYAPPDRVIDEWIILDGPEAHHIRTVMRLKKGDSLTVVDGMGDGYRCVITAIKTKEVECNILSVIRNFNEPHSKITLAAGLSTGYKFDDVIQRCTELGVVSFIPMVTDKSRIKIDDPKHLKAKLNRWEKVAMASMKQTGRGFLPQVDTIKTYGEIMEGASESSPVLLFDPSMADRNLNSLEIHTGENSFTLAIGPESGFSREEIELAREKKCPILSLGKRVLRTENASPAAVALTMFLLGELR